MGSSRVTVRQKRHSENPARSSKTETYTPGIEDWPSRIPAVVQANFDFIRGEEVAREKKTERGLLQSSTPDHK